MILALVGATALCLVVARPRDVGSRQAPAEPEPVALRATEPVEAFDAECLSLCPQRYPAIPPHSPHSSYHAVDWHCYPGQDTEPAGDPLWRARYLVYQELITYWSRSAVPEKGTEAVPVESSAIALLHGRNDVLDNATLIAEVAPDYPEIPAIFVAASIAHQASDVERAFGVDILEQIAINFPGLDNMSIGIAQLRPTETESLGLGEVDLFDPEFAIDGMFTKIRLSGVRIDELQNPISPVPPTDRAMLLSLAQNSPTAVDAFFAAGGDWDAVLAQANNQRVMRYFMVHLDWLVECGWELPGDVDLGRWRAIVFSAPVVEEP
jgi:hypothetical protein